MAFILRNVSLCVVVLMTAKIVMAQDGSLQVVQSEAVARLVEQHVDYNGTHPMMGYRIRLFRDNNATARQKAHEARERFAALYPDTKTYINYDNPYFKVTAGDFRSRDDALALFVKVRRQFPKAFIVMEYIRLPPLYRNENDDE